MFHTVFSAESGNATSGWQAELLAWSFRRAGEQGPLTMLCAGGDDQVPGVETFSHRNWRHAYGEDYPPYNKPAGLHEWLQAGGPDCDTVLIVDPDCLWFGTTLEEWLGDLTLRPGEAVTQSWSYHGGLKAFCNSVKHPLVVPVGIPTLIRTDDLKAAVPWWLTHTRAIRQTRTMHDPFWNAEMGGYMLAAAEIGLRQELMDVDCGPLLHYYSWRPCIDGWQKYEYRPWEPLSVSGSPARQALAALINEYGATRG